MGSIFKNIITKYAGTNEFKTEDYVYTAPEEPHYVSIHASNKYMQQMIQSTFMSYNKVTKEDERVNVTEYYNSVHENKMRLSELELYDFKWLITQKLSHFNNKKGNILNTIILQLIFLLERGVAFSIDLLYVFVPVIKKYKLQTFNKKFNEIYRCLHLWKPSTFKHVYKYYAELPMGFYLRGLTMITRTFFTDYIGTDQSFQLVTADKDIGTYTLDANVKTGDFQNLCRFIERTCISITVWIITMDRSDLHATRIVDYYKIYLYVILNMLIEANASDYDDAVILNSGTSNVNRLMAYVTPMNLSIIDLYKTPKAKSFYIYIVNLITNIMFESGNKLQTVEVYYKQIGEHYSEHTEEKYGDPVTFKQFMDDILETI